MISPQKQPAPGYHSALACTIIAAIFCVAVCIILVVGYIERSANNPLESEQYAALKQQLFAKPADSGETNAIPSEEEIAAAQKRRQALKEEIRALDLRLRQEYFRQRSFAHMGGLLLLVGVVVLLTSARIVARLRPWIPMPEPSATPHDPEPQVQRAARWSIGLLGVLLVVSILVIAALLPAVRATIEDGVQLAAKTPESSNAQTTAKTETVTTKPENAPAAKADELKIDLSTYPTAEEIKKNWPRFRGPGGLGISAYENLPTTWDAVSGKSIVWKTPVPLPGHNSPVVWGDRVFLTGADKSRREIYAFDAKNGKIVWTYHAKGTPAGNAKPPEVHKDTGFAAPSIATDGRRLVAWFANGDVVCLDLNSKKLWERSLGIPENSYGHATSPLIHKNLVLLKFDQASAGDGKSKAMALDSSTGKTVWEKPRKVPNSWSTPIVINHGGREQFITTADPWVIAYSPTDGTELWRVECLSGDHGISPVFAAGMVQIGNEYCEWAAIKPDGKGDVTKTHIAWTAEDGLPDTVSPLANDEFLILMTAFGVITCYDIKTGKMLWEEDLEKEITSSPSFVGKNVYIFSKTKDGKCWVVEPTREACKRVSEASLGESCVTSPAFQDGRFYIRGQKNLFCIGNK
ncbi:MAG: PQQ-binding-like beta-propeller repeat protein [Pirellulales bacterium]|nr:PQQ-binding-like beta-propeller repeat protein [Pirellulales bacterium]